MSKFTKMPTETEKLKSIIPDSVWDLFCEFNVILAGGAITSLFTSREINDFDLYLRDRDTVIAFVEEAFSSNYQMICTNYTEKSILFIDKHGNKYQLIFFRDFQDTEDIFKSFDFTVCMGVFDFKKEAFKFHDEFFKHNSQRYLSYNPQTDFPIISLLRSNKYRDKGYYISRPQLIRIVLSCMDLDISTWDEFASHIGGMYGYQVKDLFDEEDEFSIEKALEKLDTLTNVFVPDQPTTIVKNEILAMLKGDDIIFYKTVRKKDGKYLSFIMMNSAQQIEYKLGEYVNGGENGIYCRLESECGGGYRLDGNDKAVIELKPKKQGNWKINDFECQLLGDVLVTKIYEYDGSVKEIKS